MWKLGILGTKIHLLIFINSRTWRNYWKENNLYLSIDILQTSRMVSIYWKNVGQRALKSPTQKSECTFELSNTVFHTTRSKTFHLALVVIYRVLKNKLNFLKPEDGFAETFLRYNLIILNSGIVYTPSRNVLRAKIYTINNKEPNVHHEIKLTSFYVIYVTTSL